MRDHASRSRSKPVRDMSEYTKELYYPCMTALTANLLTNIANGPRIAGVMGDGRWPSKADIEARLAARQ
jgi:hypothetical protein